MESDIEIFQMLELSSEDIKAAIKAMLLNIKKKGHNEQAGIWIMQVLDEQRLERIS